MTLNKSKGNMYDFIDTKWNPLGGECCHKCEYCSTNRFRRYKAVNEKYTGIPKIINKELKYLGKNKIIFVVSQNDLFAKSIPDSFILKILNHCCKYDNIYYFQTKNPARYLDFIPFFPKKSIFCTTIETDFIRHGSIIPTPHERLSAMINLPKNYIRHITIEPIQDFSDYFYDFILSCNPNQINIGANTSIDVQLHEPSKNKILKLIHELEKFTIVKQKSNLKRLLK